METLPIHGSLILSYSFLKIETYAAALLNKNPVTYRVIEQKMNKKIKNGFLILLFSYGFFLVFDSLGIFFQIDKTLTPSYYLEYSKSKNFLPPPVYLVSYAGKKSVFFKNQNAQAMSAINNGIDYIMMYKRRDIDPIFYEKNKHILNIAAGDGLWIWKPYFILRTMDIAPEDSLIIYADSPVIFKKPITPL